MARLLVKAIDYVHPDPDVDIKDAYKRGDVVCVMPDGHVWGLAEGAPKFLHVDLPDVSVDSLLHLVGTEVQRLDEIAGLAALKHPRLRRLISREKNRELKRRRKYSIDIENSQIVAKTRI